MPTTVPALTRGPASDELESYWSNRPGAAVPRVSPGRGRGLFALVPIGRGELIDRACTIPITVEQCLTLDLMRPLGDFYFADPDDPRAGLMILGLASLCNHADAPNADVRFRDGGAVGWLAELVAIADIAAGAEITYRYKCQLWFDEVIGQPVARAAPGSPVASL
jgi:SET domain-containing protein